MKRREFVLAGAAALALPAVANAQGKTPVIGLLWNDSVKPSPFVTILLDALREHGWVAGRDFRVEDRVTLEGYGAYARDVAELVGAKVDVIVTYGATATAAAAKATKQIPIVTITGVDPVAAGQAASLSRPGGNVTGILTRTADLTGKRLELLKELIPGLSRIGVMLAPNVNNPNTVRNAEAAARMLELKVHFAEARAPGEIESVIADLVKARVEALHVTASTMLASHSKRVVAAVTEHRIPTVYGVERYVDAGGLMTYSNSVRKAFARAANYVDKVLKGARPGELAIEQVSDVELIVNLRTAKALGLTIPQSILVRADRVIE